MSPSLDLRRVALGGVVMFLGGSGLVYEYCLSTLATHLIGNSVEQFSIVIALMLFAMGIAGAAQRRMGLAGEASVATTFVAVEIALALVGGASAIALYLAFSWLEHFRFALYGLAMIIGFGIGLEIPLLLRLNEGWQGNLKDNVGEILSLDYVGALLGALVWAFVLLPWLPLDRISLVLGFANLVAAAVTLWFLRDRTPHGAPLVASIVGAAAVLAALWFMAPRLIHEARQEQYVDPVRHHATSTIQDIVVTGRGRRMTLYLNSRLQFDSEDEHVYHEMLVHPALQALGRPPVRVMVLGGGDGLAVREVFRWPSVRDVLLVDLDPAVTELARRYPPLVALNGGALNDPRVRIQHGDADAYLRGGPAEAPWDAVIVDFPDPSSPDLAKLFSLEFYQQLGRRLAPDGVAVMQSGSPYATRRAFWSVRDTVEAAGLQVLSLQAHVPTFGQWGWHLARPSGADPIRPVGPAPPGARYVRPDVVEASMVFPSPLARPAGPPQVSTRLNPVVMRLYSQGEPLDGATLFAGHAGR